MDSVTVVGGRSVWDEWRHIYGNTYTTIYKIDSQWEFAVLLRELKSELGENLEGWDGVGSGRQFREETCIPMADLC